MASLPLISMPQIFISCPFQSVKCEGDAASK
jgi:hypothetical protein